METALAVAAALAVTCALLDCVREGGRFWTEAWQWIVITAAIDTGLAVSVAYGLFYLASAWVDAAAVGAVSALSLQLRRALERVTNNHRWWRTRRVALARVAEVAAARRAVWVATTVYEAARFLPRPVVLRVVIVALKDAERLGRPLGTSGTAARGIAPAPEDDLGLLMMLDRLLNYGSLDVLAAIVVSARCAGWSEGDLGSEGGKAPRIVQTQQARDAS